ncbi:Nn.00g107240.m01.CDS01 [Neocucurbitaria sp. VM-36]
MKTSKYAPKTPAENLAQSRAEKFKHDKDRATRLLRRLRWKAELLMVSYYRTLEIVQAESQENGHHESHHAMESGATGKRQADSMFKIDFFEWYTLLERYITDCLAVLGFSISATAPLVNINALRYITNPDLHKTRPLAFHAFHANLLEALDDEKCPLHTSLGTQAVRVQLGLAKDFRNAWKDADEKVTHSQAADNADFRKNIKLHDLQLEMMLRTIIVGCEHAHSLVQGHDNATIHSNALASQDFEPQTYGYNSMDTGDMPFEYMDDAMDLD